MNLEQLRSALAEKTKGLDALRDAAFADDATDEAVKALEDALSEIEDLEKKIKTAERIADIQARQATPATDPAPNAPAAPKKDVDKLTTFGKIGLATVGLMRANATDRNRSWKGAADQLDKMGYGEVAVEIEQRAMNSGAGSAGGFTIGEDFNEDIFRELIPYTGFLEGGPEIQPMPRGNWRQSGVATRPTASYRAEGAVIAASEPTVREIDMSAKLLSSVVPLTNELIDYSGGRAARTAEATLRTSVGLTMDAAAFEGTGTSNTPLGMFNQPGITTAVATDSATPTIAQVEADLRPLINVIMQYAQLGIRVAWTMTQRVKGYLEDMRDGNGNKYFPELSMENPRLKGFRVIVSGSIANNGGVGTDESTIGLISYGTVLLGESGGLEIAISDEASYDSGGGTMVSAFANNLTLIRATMAHDWQPRYNESIATLTAVKWGS